MVVDDDPLIVDLLRDVLEDEGHSVVTAGSGREALQRLQGLSPHLIISDVVMPDMDGFSLVQTLRRDAATQAIPLIFLTSKKEKGDMISGLQLGGDDYLTKPFDVEELIARVRSKTQRPPVPSNLMPRDPATGLLTKKALLEELDREYMRARTSERAACLAYLYIRDMARLRERFGRRGEDEVAFQISQLVAEQSQALDLVARDESSLFLILLPEADAASAEQRLYVISRAIASHAFRLSGEHVRLTPVIRFSSSAVAPTPGELRDQAWRAVHHAAADLNLRPLAFDPSMAIQVEEERPKEPGRGLLGGRARLPLQIAATWLLGIVVPFIAYALLDRAGHDVTGPVYLIVTVALVITAALIWIEGFFALKRIAPPDRPSAPYPPASAVIAAYLPNEAATILDTVEAFLSLDYPAPLEIILAYNTPQTLPVEETLREIAKRDARLRPLRVEGSESKAQNVNAGLSEATGEFVAVFDADHLPQPDSFRRAWRWLSNGYDVVQGHCLVRNGDASWVARMVAVEFEAIYAVSHPGRARLHKFGIFGGSNGYWRAHLLSATRMHGFMLTEDIDSSMRVLEAGGKIVCDPQLVSRELAPGTLKSLWNQRMRWAQVSREHLWRGLRSRRLALRQKLGLLFLLGWREIYPWLSLQVFPIVAYWIWKHHGADKLDWLIPVFVLTTLFTFSVGPGQTLFAWRLAAPEIRARKSWFLFYLVVSILFYTEFKNQIARVAQLKEALGERDWRVTPRPVASGGDEGS